MSASPAYIATAVVLRTFFAPFTRRRILGSSHIPHSGPCILAPNHISHFDPPLLGISLRRQVDWMAMRELFQIPLLGAWLRQIGSFPVTMGRFDAQATRTAVTRLRAGRMIGIFPEGGLRTGPQSVLEGAPIRPGVAALAQMTGSPVVPCIILGSDALYSPTRWLPLRRTHLWIAFEEPLAAPAGGPDKAAARKDFEARLGDALRSLYRKILRDENIPQECLPQTPQRRKGRE